MRAMIAALVLALMPALLHAEAAQILPGALALGPEPPAAEAPLPDERILAAATAGVAVLMHEATKAVIEVRVSISKQMMEVRHRGELVYEWPVSTARKGKITPLGSFRPQWLSRNHKSSLYNNAPMPHSIFYSGNYAIHGTDQEAKLGRPASAGCVRLSRANAKILFAMVVEEGKDRMRVDIVD
ncbi:L,D-transpeptidase [Pseudogemmobacter humi]|uniref:L,D-TPase catalytic domain-containing protein n=1 Tax=Pseudogemmobacter humi TaxID=2483812 RepID=A0A3P5XBY1_9RHOB|nr:L,D-transpeptidase [Pseudogemmobacter humi]VDC32328.1 hypothetical protein XINFAN_03379 [Pseudogemmobacter humi]